MPVRSGEAARARSSTPTFTLKRTRLPIQGVDKPRVDREKLHTPLAFSVYMLLLYALRSVRIVALKEKTAQEFKKASSLRVKKRVPLLITLCHNAGQFVWDPRCFEMECTNDVKDHSGMHTTHIAHFLTCAKLQLAIF